MGTSDGASSRGGQSEVDDREQDEDNLLEQEDKEK